MAELVYLYGLIKTEDAKSDPLPSLNGIDDQHEIHMFPLDEITAIVCHLDSNDYTETAIKEKISNDMEWLQKKAFHHHETLLALQKQYTIIPAKFCTIYSNEDSLETTIKKHKTDLITSLALLKGNEEWNLKIYCDDAKLEKHLLLHNSKIDKRKQEISELPPGRQFFERKKIDQLVKDELEQEKNLTCEKIHADLKQFSLKETVKKNWSKDVTGRTDNMSWNSVYLLPFDQVNDFLDSINQTNENLDELGWRFEPSGPWPPYHFASLQ